MGNAVELSENTQFHLFRSLVGKGYSQDGAIGVRIVYHQGHVFAGKGKGLTRARTCLVNGEL